jgi:hypothetical protein
MLYVVIMDFNIVCFFRPTLHRITSVVTESKPTPAQIRFLGKINTNFAKLVFVKFSYAGLCISFHCGEK